MKKTQTVTTSKLSDFIKYATAVGGLTIGFLLMLASLILWGFSAAENQNHDLLELFLIVTAFGFLAGGAHGLDLMQHAKRAETKRRLNI